MYTIFTYNFKSIAVVCTMAMLFLSCQDNYKRVGEEAQKKTFPQGVAENFKLIYTETNEDIGREGVGDSRIIAILESPISEDFENLSFKYRTFPKGLTLDFFDDDNKKSIIRADYAIIYSETNVIDLQGNVIMESHDGKRMETSQVYWDRSSEWIFTEANFRFIDPEEGTDMKGKGMNLKRDFSFFKAHQTQGDFVVKEEEQQDD